MPETLRATAPKARKDHLCGTCNRTITAGERYHLSANLYDGRVYDWRECSDCIADAITNEVYAWAGSPDEGVGFEQAEGWAHDNPSPEAARFLVRMGCQCEQCESTGDGDRA